MTVAYPDRGGWFADCQSQTGAASSLVNISKYFIAAGLVAGLGTGPAVNDLERLRQLQVGDVVLSSPLDHYVVEAKALRTPAEDVEKIREILSPAMSNIAKMLGVSRQTIYNWSNGELPTTEHAAKLQDIAIAADILSASGIVPNGLLLKRKLVDGRNLYDLIAAGRSAQDSVQRLVQIVKRESAQKEMLSSRFSGRTKSTESADSDIITENDKVL
ncbi:MAG: hypothetical protein SCI25_01890 [Desulfuromonadales bacterium]|nr:hypothetical protein [Desulfuromonadales bacterium]MDW7756177.1 hypothetical protein [Desulfuromonadales bacterium]